MILVDSNLALRLIETDHPHHVAASFALARYGGLGVELAIAPQSFYEIYVVMTRPTDVGGFGFSSEQAFKAINRIEGFFTLVAETRNIFAIWRSLVKRYAVIGKRAHDVRLVAMMMDHGINEIVTFNDADFKQFTEIKTINPTDLLGRN